MTVKYNKFIRWGVLGIFLAGTLGFSGPVAAEPTSAVEGDALRVKDTFFASRSTFLPVRAQVLTAFGLRQKKAIDFGRFSVSSAGGIIAVSEGAVFHTSGITVEGASGGLTTLDAMSSALAPGESITVSVVGPPLSGPGASMQLQGFCQIPGSAPGYNNAPCSIVATSGVSLDVIIGGVLVINAEQAPGTYYGVMQVTAEF